MKRRPSILLTYGTTAAAAFALGTHFPRTIPERPTAWHRSVLTAPVVPGKAADLSQQNSSKWQTVIDARIASAAGLDERGLLAALKHLDASPGDALSTASRHVLIAMLAERSPESAIGYAESLPASARSAAALTAYMSWAARDPVAAANRFAEESDVFGVLSAAQREAAGSLAATLAAQDPNAAISWARELPEDQRGVALAGVIAAINKSDPLRTAGFINDMEEGYERTELIQAVVRQKTAQTPEKMAAWVLSIDGVMEQKSAASTLVSTWAAKDVASAATWVSSLPAGDSRDAAAAALINAPSFSANQDLTQAWVESISDPSLRDAALRTAVRRYGIIAAGW